MNFTVKDFCYIYSFSRQSFYKRIKHILPILNSFDPGKRKRTYKMQDIPLILECMPKDPKKIKLDFSNAERSYLSSIISYLSKPDPLVAKK